MVRPLGLDAVSRSVARGPAPGSAAPPETARAIVPAAPTFAPSSVRPRIGTDSALVTQLIAHAEDAAWTRQRRRATPACALAAYRATAALLPPAERPFGRDI